MKFFSWLTTILIGALIIAAFTTPGDEKFVAFIAKDKGGDTMACKPLVGKTSNAKILSVTLFSFHYVNYCEQSKFPTAKTGLRIAGQRLTHGDSIAVAIGKYSAPKIIRSESYLGLFGRFWKL